MASNNHKSTPAPTLAEVLKSKHILQAEVREVLRDKYDCVLAQPVVNKMCHSTLPEADTKAWKAMVKCLDEEFGIRMEMGGWNSYRAMSRPPKEPKKRGNPNIALISPINSMNQLQKTDENRELISNLLTEVIHAYKQPKVKSDEELIYRIDLYFNQCAERGQIPTVEELALYVGYTSEYFLAVEKGTLKGFSSETGKIFKRAKEMLKTFDAKLVTSGKLNFLTYCFRSKNYYGMVDRQEYVAAPPQKPENEFDEEDIRKRYAVETTFTDED